MKRIKTVFLLKECKPRRSAIFAALLFLMAPIFGTAAPMQADQKAVDPPLAAQARYVMGTMLEIQLPSDAVSRDELFASLFSIARRHDEIFSTFKPQSPVSLFNKNGRELFAAPSELIELASISKEFSEKTEGTFDITVGPLMRCWKDAIEKQRWPSADEIDAVRSRVGAERLAIDPKSAAITTLVGGMELDFGGIAKGYCVDKMAEAMRTSGVRNGFINFGESSIAAIGTDPEGKPWSIAVRDPADPDRIAALLRLSDMTISTSGSYEHSGRIGKRLVNHILDPRTGMPVNTGLAVTVIAPSATLAEALSKALIVLGPVEGFKILKSFPDAQAILFYRSKRGRWKRLMSDGMKKFL